jgi:sugar/nucleoside kinase (ribokinase family)
MKKFNVYGIGNALVDLEFKVTTDFLKENDVAKGLMTLVNEDKQRSLISAIDHNDTVKKSGGSAGNTVMAVSQFGGKAFYSCKVSADEYGDHFLADMNDAGIVTNLDDIERSDGATGKCLVMITDDADRTMNTFLGVSEDLSVSEVNESAIKDSDFVYLEGYAVTSNTAFEALKLTKKTAEDNGVLTSLTLSDPSIVQYFKPRFKELVGASVDLLFCNEDEAREFTDTDNLLDAREALKQDAKRFVITQGANGAMIFDGDTFIDIEPYPVHAVDTNGAGDMFAGAFLYGLTNGMGFAGSGKLASLASSQVVAQYGPRLKWHEMQEIKNKV